MPLGSQLGLKPESVYGTAVTVDAFCEYTSENVKATAGRVESTAHRAGTRVQRSDRFQPYFAGAAGPIEMPVMTKGHGVWFKHALGANSTSGPTDLNYLHTATIGSLLGDSLTIQANRNLYDETDQAFTWEGCKITRATWTATAEGLLTATYEIDAEDEKTGTALASASYPSGADVFDWAGISATVAASAFEIAEFTISITNPLNVDRRRLRGSTVKKEPVENGLRVVEWSMKADFTALAPYSRIMDPDRADTLAALVITCNGRTAHAGSTLPSVVFTIPASRWDDQDGLGVSGFDPLEPTWSGIGLFDGTNSALKIEYTTTDTTVP